MAIIENEQKFIVIKFYKFNGKTEFKRVSKQALLQYGTSLTLEELPETIQKTIWGLMQCE